MSGCEGLAVKRIPMIVLPVDVEESIIAATPLNMLLSETWGEWFSAAIDKVDVRRYKRDGQLGDKCPSRK